MPVFTLSPKVLLYVKASVNVRCQLMHIVLFGHTPEVTAGKFEAPLLLHEYEVFPLHLGVDTLLACVCTPAGNRSILWAQQKPREGMKTQRQGEGGEQRGKEEEFTAK